MFLGIRYEADKEFTHWAVSLKVVIGPLLTTVASFGRGNQKYDVLRSSLTVPHATTIGLD